MGDGNILKLYCGNGCTTLHVYWNNQNFQLQLVNFSVCKLCLNKTLKKRLWFEKKKEKKIYG